MITEKKELVFYIALAHYSHMTARRQNEVLATCFKKQKALSYFFECDETTLSSTFNITQDELEAVSEVKQKLANITFQLEDLLEQGYDLIPITDERYPRAIKANLKYSAPSLLYSSGNIELLNTPCDAIVGSRNAMQESLDFTTAVAESLAAKGRTVVSGFARGIDRQAFDAAIEAGGNTIAIVPQGILTFASYMKEIYKPLISGKVTIVSPYAPNMPWSASLAMARNSLIYGIAEHIYVAQSDNKGGTYSGVVSGLKKKRSIYIRYPGDNEKNANRLLIDLGGIPVDANGDPIKNMSREIDNLKEGIEKRLSYGRSATAKELAKELLETDDIKAQNRIKSVINLYLSDKVQKVSATGKSKSKRFTIPMNNLTLF